MELLNGAHLESKVGRKIKFTPERIEQIKNLVERGKSRHEIAQIIECTVGSLQVTCSKLGISLRQHRFGTTDTVRKKKKEMVLTPLSADIVTSFPMSLALVMRLGTYEKIIELNLPREVITRLALEAVCRDITIAELVASILQKG